MALRHVEEYDAWKLSPFELRENRLSCVAARAVAGRAEGGAHAAGAVAAGSVAAMPTMAVSRNEIRFGRRCIGSPFLD